MKRSWIGAGLLLALLLLGGCKGPEGELDRAMALRAKLLASSVSFDAGITADYGDVVYEFSVDCRADRLGKVTFSVTGPEIDAQRKQNFLAKLHIGRVVFHRRSILMRMVQR